MQDHLSSAPPVRGVSDPRRPDAADDRFAFAEAARFYLQLSPRQLPSRFLYDALGSALFDAICQLPWYGITRAELRLLAHARTIGDVLGDGGRLVELGCGNGEKLAALLTSIDVSDLHAHLIDLSDAALARSLQTLSSIEHPSLRVTTHQTTYEDGLLALPPEPGGHATLVAFLGSNIGNFDPPAAAAFLRQIRSALAPHDHLLLGADLVKPERELLLAYDDPLGLTAAFNKNLLLRMNTELNATFALDRFAHRAVWNRDASRVEMHLVSLSAQHVEVPGAELDFRLDEGETIWTESSYKYEPEDIDRLVQPAGFLQRRQWIDERGRFALTLFEAA